jgi:polyisoprenyl-teichoic acid--peptidoglycan teichoic acid transferase
MRHEDPQGDFGRNARQRQVLQAVMSKGKSISTVSKINKILGTELLDTMWQRALL